MSSEVRNSGDSRSSHWAFADSFLLTTVVLEPVLLRNSLMLGSDWPPKIVSISK